MELARFWVDNNSNGRMGIGDFFTANAEPENTLEIMASLGSPYWGQPGGTSGLRFTFLNSNSLTIPNPGSGVLSVDENGDVIYIDASSIGPGPGAVITADNGITINPLTNAQWGQINTGIGALNGGQLIHNTEIPTNGFNVSFPGQGTLGIDRFQIGAEVPVLTSTKVYIQNNVENHAVVANHDGASIPLISQNTAAIQGNTTNFLNGTATGFFMVVGVGGFSSNLSSMNSTGVHGRAGIAIRERVGVQGTSLEPQSTLLCSNFGGRFTGSNAPNNFGVFANAAGGNSNIAVWGAVNSTAPSNWAAYFVGNSFTTANSWTPSDSTLKQNITSEQSILSQLTRLRPVNYAMRQDEFPYLGLAGSLQHGFISQEVQELFPELVQTIVHPAQYDTLGVETSPQTEILGLNYNGFISLNTQAIIELNRKVENQTLSDESLKIEVIDLENSLDKILDLRGVTYQWSPGAIDSLQLDYETHIGFIAQEVQEVDPLLTYLDDMELLHVDYVKVVPVLVEAIQEMSEMMVGQEAIIGQLNNTVSSQQEQINDLNDRLTIIENCLSGILPFLCQLNNTMIQPTQEDVQNQMRAYIDVELNNSRSIVLDQNVPNPFAETTVITYSIPESVSRAQIHFYDASGNLIKSVEITERGDGQLNVFGQDLSSGLYTYSLVADGQMIATKKMVKQ